MREGGVNADVADRDSTRVGGSLGREEEGGAEEGEINEGEEAGMKRES